MSVDRNIAGVLHRVAAEMGERPALTVVRKGQYCHHSFHRLAEQCDGYAAALAQGGIRPGDRVMLMVRPSLEFVSLTFALFQVGAVVILIDPGMGYRNLLRCIASVQPAYLVGIPAVVLFSQVFRRPFRTVRKRFVVGRSLGPLARGLKPSTQTVQSPRMAAAADQLAAIIFTTGSTGPPKGVEYTHGIFHTQLELIRNHYQIGPDDVDQPGFPLFALFSTALGARAVIPDMDPTRPAQVDPQRFTRSIIEQQVTYSFGSPAIWNVVSRYCREHDIVLPVRKVLMAGAPVPGELIERVTASMAPDGEVHTPYGATESLPSVSITGKEILAETWGRTQTGAGTCVGRALPGMTVRVIRAVDGPIRHWSETEELPVGDIGEIVVKGPVVTRAYFGNPGETLLAKIEDDEGFYHRFGDMGYFDQQGRLWFCGRKAHRVHTDQGILYTICCEAIFNVHSAVRRSALVGVGEKGQQRPVLLVELEGKQDWPTLRDELTALAQAHPLTRQIETFLVHQGFPVDIRHNAKIFREKLAKWATEQLQG